MAFKALMRSSMRAQLWLLMMLAATTVSTAKASDEPVKVAVASSLRQLWPELVLSYQQQLSLSNAEGIVSSVVRASFSSSGNLTRQILQGAPFELFISANVDYAQRLDSASKVVAAPRTLAFGRLVWAARVNTDVGDVISENREASIQRLLLQFARRPNFKLAIANPRHAPYGVAAEQVLTALLIDSSSDEAARPEPLKAQLLNGENAAQALQFVLSGGADLALVPLSLVMQPNKSLEQLVFQEVLLTRYEPVEHQLVLLNNASQSARRFYDYLSSPAAMTLLANYGFTQ